MKLYFEHNRLFALTPQVHQVTLPVEKELNEQELTFVTGGHNNNNNNCDNDNNNNNCNNHHHHHCHNTNNNNNNCCY